MPEGTLRALDVRQDLDALVDLTEVTFPDAMERRGGDLRSEIDRMKRLLPLILLLGRISSEMRHIFDGFVWEQNDQVVGMVLIQKMGNDPTRWLVGNVATHPDYRRRGIARHLVRRAMAYAREHGARACLLGVKEDNKAAFHLYHSIGFVQYDSTTELKLETLPQVQTVTALGYRLRPMKLGTWRRRYGLARRATPAGVQEFLPVSEGEYRVTPLGRWITPLLLLVQRLADHWWAADEGEHLAGWLRLLASRSQGRTHDLTLMLDPAHRGEVAWPLLSVALETLRRYPPGAATLSVRSSETELLDVLSRLGFCSVETTRRMGIKLNNTPGKGYED